MGNMERVVAAVSPVEREAAETRVGKAERLLEIATDRWERFRDGDPRASDYRKRSSYAERRQEYEGPLVTALAEVEAAKASHGDRLDAARSKATDAAAQVERLDKAIAERLAGVDHAEAKRLEDRAGGLAQAANHVRANNSPAGVVAWFMEEFRKRDLYDEMEDELPAQVEELRTYSPIAAAMRFDELAADERARLERLRGDGALKQGRAEAAQALTAADAELAKIEAEPEGWERAGSWERERLAELEAEAAPLKAAFDAATKELADAQAALAAIEATNAPHDEAADNEFTVLRVTVQHSADGGSGDLSHLNWSFEGDDEDDVVGIRAVADCLVLSDDFMGSLQGVRCDGADLGCGQPATYFVAIKGAGWRPPQAGDGEAEFVLGGYRKDLPIAKGAKLNVELVGDLMMKPSDVFHCVSVTLPADIVGMWGGKPTPDRMPVTGELPVDWLRRVALSPDVINRKLERLERSGRNLLLLSMLLDDDAVEDESGGAELWAGGPRLGEVTLLAGSPGVGKSTFGHSLLSAVGSTTGPHEILGQKLLVSGLPVAIITGEETRQEIDARREIFKRTFGNVCPFVMRASGPEGLATAIAMLEAWANGGVVMVDSFFKFSDGNDSDAHIASAFYTPLMNLAAWKNCAVIALHHMNKGSTGQIDEIHGSVAHRSNPRMVLTLAPAKGGRIRLRMGKCNRVGGGWLKENETALFDRDAERLLLLPSEGAGKENETALFDRDAERLLLLPSEGAGKASKAEAGADIVEPEDIGGAIIAAVKRLNADGVRVTKSGRRGLYQKHAPELAGVGRNRLEAVIAALVESGELGNGPDGLSVAVADGPGEAAPPSE